MSVSRDELHQLVDELPEERLAPVLRLIRGDERKARAAATLKLVQQRLAGVRAGVADRYIVDTGVFVRWFIEQDGYEHQLTSRA